MNFFELAKRSYYVHDLCRKQPCSPVREAMIRTILSSIGS